MNMPTRAAAFASRVLAATVTSGLGVRTMCVLAFTAPLSMLLGLCFPIGVRLIAGTPAIVAWAWGLNGAFSVLASAWSKSTPST